MRWENYSSLGNGFVLKLYNISCHIVFFYSCVFQHALCMWYSYFSPSLIDCSPNKILSAKITTTTTTLSFLMLKKFHAFIDVNNNDNEHNSNNYDKQDNDNAMILANILKWKYFR